jgi:hypothetical protein
VRLSIKKYLRNYIIFWRISLILIIFSMPVAVTACKKLYMELR